jgi:FHA domain
VENLRTDKVFGAWSASELQAIIRAERTYRAFLVWRDDPGKLRLIGLDGRSTVIVGRSPGSDIQLDDTETSRTHAELRLVGSDWIVEDEGLSRNGTFVNEVRLGSRRRLTDRDMIRFGRASVQFRCPSDGPAEATSAGTFTLFSDLTETQRRVLVVLCRPYLEGKPFAVPARNADISRELFLGVDAVKNHLRLLYQRFAIADLPQNEKRARLAELAIQAGVVGDREP